MEDNVPWRRVFIWNLPCSDVIMVTQAFYNAKQKVDWVIWTLEKSWHNSYLIVGLHNSDGGWEKVRSRRLTIDQKWAYVCEYMYVFF